MAIANPVFAKAGEKLANQEIVRAGIKEVYVQSAFWRGCAPVSRSGEPFVRNISMASAASAWQQVQLTGKGVLSQ
jgi:hypothetical protein